LDLSYAERIFIYLPFEHSEDKGDQVSGNNEQQIKIPQGFDYGLGGCRTLLSHFGHKQKEVTDLFFSMISAWISSVTHSGLCFCKSCTKHYQ